MFRTGRRGTALLRATAGLGVALMLVGLYRPGFAFASVDAAKGASAAPASTPAVAAPTAAPAASERVRSAIVPAGVKLDKGAMGVDPSVLFDGDGTTVFQTGQPLRVRVSLPKGVALETIGIYGGKGAVVSASVDGSSGVKPIEGLERAALDGLAARWNRFSAKAPVETSVLLLDITPAPGQRAEVPELELWGRAAPSARPSSSRAWAEALLTHLPAGAVQVAASPATATIAAPQIGPAGHVPVTFDLDRAPRTFERAFLVYELEGLAHWSSVVRRVNWNAPQGGFHAVGIAHKGLQVEEISPDWLRQGRNELQFLVANVNDLAGYKVKNLRVVGVPAAGNPDARPQIDTPRADKIAAALVDGSRETGLTNKDLRKPQTVDFRFAETSQLDSLLVAVDKGAKGTLSAQAIVRGTVDRTSQVGAELDQLGTGWARLPLDSLPADADGIRVTLRGARGESSGGLVSELRVTGSRLPTRHLSSLTVTHPLHGECVDGEAYVRGFIRGDASGGTKGATLRISGAMRPDALKWDGSFSAVMQPPGAALRRGGKWQVELEARFANGDTTGAAVDIEGCKEPVAASKKTGPREDEGAPFGQVVRAGQSAKLAFAGATLEIPAGALDDDTRVTIRPISDVEIPATDETLTNVTAGGRAYRLGPHGLKFGKAIKLTIPFDRSRFVGGQAEDDMGAYFFDEEAKRWRQVQTLKGDASNQMLTAATDHFTDFIAGTISTPDHPTADSFNPNSIKDLKAADPTAGINLIQPPEASPDGAAHLSFPLWVPPGRQGMQPSLAVTYNSSAGNGLMGMGWSLPISSIGVDTRFGVARYSRTQETETYEIDGELLVMDPLGPGQTVRGAKTKFHRKAEGKFDAIYRIAGNLAGPIEEPIPGGSNDAYHWEVVDKRGTRFIYGETYTARGSVQVRGVFRWYLSRVIDAFGNQIIYTYEKRFPFLHQVQPGQLDVPTVEVLLKSIQYTADSNGQNAPYRVEFFYDGQTSGDVILTQQRPDVFTNARGGSIEVTNVRLARIQVYENPKTDFNNIRRYDFRYTLGSFLKSLLYDIVVAQGAIVPDPDETVMSGGEFYRHTFQYYGVPKNQAGRVAFDAPVAWSGAGAGVGMTEGESDSVNGSLAVGGSFAGCDLFHTAVRGSTSLSLPIPLPSSIADKNKNQDKAMRGLVDVNGDGLPDFVTPTGVQLNRGDSTFSAGTRTFGPFDSSSPFKSPEEVHLAGRSSVGLSLGAHFLYEAGHATALGRNWGSAGDEKMLADIDGDGFVDYLKSDGNFVLNYKGLGLIPIAGWGTLPKTEFLPASAIAEQKTRFTLTEPTAMWVAPFAGHVLVRGFARKTQAGGDGVKIMVDAYHTTAPGPGGVPANSSSLFSGSTTIAGNNTSLVITPGADLLVLKGDRIYFRVNAIDDIDNDLVQWSPLINYADTTNDQGFLPQTLLNAQKQLVEPFSGDAFNFVQGSDMRLAGQPIPTWHNDSVGPQLTTVFIKSTCVNNICPRKELTSDAVDFEVLRAVGGDMSNLQPVNITGFRKTYPADYSGPIDSINDWIVLNLGLDDRIFVRVSSESPIDPEQITNFRPSVRYFNFCRLDSLPAETTKENFHSAKTSVCGQLLNCSSPLGCDIAGDPKVASNHVAASTWMQDITPYFHLKPWQQVGLPVGFIPKSNGQITFTTANNLTSSNYVGPPARVVVRGLQRLAFEAGPVSGTAFLPAHPVPAQPIAVQQGVPVMFDVFVKNVNALQVALDVASWNVTVNFTGPSGPEITPIAARRNYLVTDDGGGHVHGWQQFERNVLDPAAPFNNVEDIKIQNFLVNGVGQNPNPEAVPVLVMRQAPDGVQKPGLTIPGPLWVGASVDGFIGDQLFKPSRTSKVMNGSRVTFSNTSTVSTDTGSTLLLGHATDYSTATTDLMLVDINGDHYPDLVRPGGIQFNRPNFDVNDPAKATSGGFEAQRLLKKATGETIGLGALDDTDGRQLSASLGLASPTAAYMRLRDSSAQVPAWVQVLPSVGISYGHSQTLGRLLDINGDGLPDYVRRNAGIVPFVRLNLGFKPGDVDQAYEFSEELQYTPSSWEFTGDDVPQPALENFLGFLQILPTDFGGDLVNIFEDTNSISQFGGGLHSDSLRVQNNAANNVGSGFSYFGGGLSWGVSRTTTDMIDINGDGLPDMVKRDPNGKVNGVNLMSVKYNMGDNFGPEEFWDVPNWPVEDVGTLRQFETAGFGENDALTFTETHGFSESAGYSQYYQFGFFGCYGIEAGIGAGQTFTDSEMRFEDIDGDGAPDQVLKLKDDPNLYVRRNPAAGLPSNSFSSQPPNLLATVYNPLGGAMSLTYGRFGNVVDQAVVGPDGIARRDVDMPSRLNVLVAVNVHQLTPQFSQETQTNTFFDYGVDPSVNIFQPTSRPSGFYDRVNREFLGFGHITITRTGDGLQIQRFYDNKSYAGRHHLLREEIRDTLMAGGPKLFRRQLNTFQDPPRQVFPGSNASLFIPLRVEQTLFYEPTPNNPDAPVRSTTIRHDYDATGNPIVMIDEGDDDPTVGGDNVHYKITYQDITEPLTATVFKRPNNVFACSSVVTATTNCPTADILRHRFAFYGPRGELLTLVDDHFGGKDPATGNPYLINQTDPLVLTFTYDGFGNVQTSTDPTGYSLNYTYDTTTNSHIRTITDQFGYQSTRDYDLRFGSLRDTTDVNGHRMHFDADVFGRTVTVFAPQDIATLSPGTLPPTGDGSLIANAATIASSYAIPGANVVFGQTPPVFWALTKNKDASHPTDTIDTVVLVDGLGRVRQTKKDANAPNGVTPGTRILGSRTTFDQVGRVFQEGFPAFDLGGAQTAFSPFPTAAFAKTYAYDVLGRVRAIQTPNNNGPDIAFDGAKVVTTKFSFDPKTLDGRLQLVKTVTDPQGKIRTQYVSPRGEILAVSEQNRLGTSNTLTTLTTRYSYDRMSELIQVQDPSANLTTASYDSLGQMVLLKSADSGQTEWRYDLSGRLAAKETANLRAKNQLIKYTYEFNRLKTIAYPPATAFPGATGLVTYTYGTNLQKGAPFGNIAGRLAMLTDESGRETHQYDTLGNVSHMEKTPTTLSPSIPGVTYKMDYLYDQLGRVQSMTYPDGELVTYGYGAGGLVNSVKGKRLNNTETTYVTGIFYNELEQRKAITLGNSSSSNYFYYPDTKRLQILQTTGGTAQLHNTTFNYDLVGNITSLTNNLPTLPPVAPNTVIVPGPTSQSFTYDDLYQLKSATGSYTGCACGCGNSRSFGLTYEYDGLGNITRKNQTDTIFKPVSGAVPQAATTYNNGYTYGAPQPFGQNAGPHAPTGVGPETLTYDRDGNQTQYSGSFGPSRSLTWTEDDRLRSEIDSGFTNQFLYNAVGDRTHKRRSTLETWYVNPQYVVKNSLTESKHIMVGSDRVVTAVATIPNRADPKTAGPNTLFYYHSDHTQSTSYVTGGDGSILQHDEYFPSGEVWFQEQKNNDARNTQPYLFSAKELDETGLYYFGARYYNPKFSVWASADPILGSYLQRGAAGASPKNLGLYSYAWNNPVVLRDPDGRMTEGGMGVPEGVTGRYDPIMGMRGYADPVIQRGPVVEEPIPLSARFTTPAGAFATARGAKWIPYVGIFIAAAFLGLGIGMASEMNAPGADNQPVSAPAVPAGPMSAPAMDPYTVMSLPPMTPDTSLSAPGAPGNDIMSAGYISPPKLLPGFPTAKRVPPKMPVQGGGGKLRARWKTPEGNILEWDYQHGAVEQFDKTGRRHLGEFDANTGERTKPGDPTRSTIK